ncbi:PAS domain-containing sensor histidine kinase [Paramagnetospirillum marisnigri]|uniref:histidine kinase n=1 Tax=Paramagnetospirillum marisnigri TaxID=1285242 RepID=A0A178MA15_9PROT|nr:PAS domain S-box protein [Paramagnetospirillum marisnigri]OAN45589.1 PAS domain-containing sensor histidine kinase [Paramagnetospirillum marisnigri]
MTSTSGTVGSAPPRATWRARLIALIAIPCILGLTGWQLYASYRDSLADSEALATALARVAEEHFGGNLRTITQVLEEATALADAGGRIDVDAFSALIAGRMQHLPFIRSAFFAGANGLAVGGTQTGIAGIDIGDREYFKVLARPDAPAIFVSSPLISRVRRETTIYIAARIRDAAGQFAGVAVVSVNPDLFEEELRTVRPPQGGFATLLRLDGTILSRVPDGEKHVGKVVGDGPATSAARQRPSGVLYGAGAVDGARRILAFRRVGDTGLVVVVGMRVDGILADWRNDALIHGMVAGVMIVLMAAMAIRSDRSHAEREQVQLALEASEARYRLLIDHSPLGIVHAAADGETLYVNARWLTLAGRQRDQVLGRKWCELVDERDRPEVGERWRGMVRDGDAFAADMRLKTPDGSLRWVRALASPLDMVPGGGGYSVSFEDTSLARMAEQSLRLSEEKFAKAFLGSPDALVISTEANGRYVEVNDAFCRLLGYGRDELLVADSLSLGIWADARDRARLVKMVGEQGQVDDFETILRRKDGSTMVVLISVQRIVVADDRCLLFICRDISERRAMEEKARSLVAKLNASNKELEQFAYVASHDLQEPLRMIAGYAQLLERRYRGRLDSDADEFIEFLVDGAKRMQVMIRDLLEYSRVDRLGGAFVVFDAAEALEDARRNLLAALQDSGALLKVAPLPEVRADRSQLVRLFQNLIGNALKYRHPERPPEIVVGAVRSGDDWVFSVADNGIGIDAEYFERIFLIFQRLHTRDQFEGTGIGLAICKKIVERHGGRLWVESVPGQGSTFYFTMPCVSTAATPA